MNVLELIKQNEGLRLDLYKCPADRWTVGYGRNLEARGITKDEAQLMLENDVEYFYRRLEKFPAFLKCNENRQAVLIDMAFNMGMSGIRKFKMMWAAISLENWQGAAIQILDSKYAREDVPERAARNAEIMRTGQFNG